MWKQWNDFWGNKIVAIVMLGIISLVTIVWILVP